MYESTHESAAAGVRWLARVVLYVLIGAAVLVALAVETVDCGGDEVLGTARTEMGAR